MNIIDWLFDSSLKFFNKNVPWSLPNLSCFSSHQIHVKNSTRCFSMLWISLYLSFFRVSHLSWLVSLKYAFLLLLIILAKSLAYFVKRFICLSYACNFYFQCFSSNYYLVLFQTIFKKLIEQASKYIHNLILNFRDSVLLLDL